MSGSLEAIHADIKKIAEQYSVTVFALAVVGMLSLLYFIYMDVLAPQSRFAPCSYSKNDGQILTMTAGDLTMQTDDRPGQEHVGPGGLDDLDQTSCDGTAGSSRFSACKTHGNSRFLNDRGSGPEFYMTSQADADFWSSEMSTNPGVISDDLASSMAAPSADASAAASSAAANVAAVNAVAAGAAADAAAAAVPPAAAPAAAAAAVSNFYARQNKAKKAGFFAKNIQSNKRGGHLSPM
jgi:hypothetical protein